MYWTFDLINHLNEAPFPATIDELVEFAERNGAPPEVIENLEEMRYEADDDDEQTVYRNLEDIWPDIGERNQYLENDDF